MERARKEEVMLSAKLAILANGGQGSYRRIEVRQTKKKKKEHTRE